MTFLSPQSLWLMLALPLLPVLYLWLLRRRGKSALRYSNLAAVRAASGRHWRRHVPPALLLLACAVLLLAAARPLAVMTLPWARSQIMLAMDVSLSMRVNDVKPTRMVAAQEAAKLFLRDLPRHIEVVVGLGTVDGVAGGMDGLAIYMQLDEPTLREVARMTGGEYHHAGTAEELRSVYQDLGSRLQVQTRETEVTGLLALAGAMLVLAAAALSVSWFGRV